MRDLGIGGYAFGYDQSYTTGHGTDDGVYTLNIYQAPGLNGCHTGVQRGITGYIGDRLSVDPTSGVDLLNCQFDSPLHSDAEFR